VKLIDWIKRNLAAITTTVVVAALITGAVAIAYMLSQVSP